MTANKFFPKIVKAILPFAPVVGVVSTCLLVASAVAQVSEPILNAGIGLQVSNECAIQCLIDCVEHELTLY
jgi:BASS family bile acid:Na+ symporter